MNSSLIGRLLWAQRGRLALLGVALLAATGLQLAVPQLLRQFIDDALAQAAASALSGLAVVFTIVVVLQIGFTLARAYLKEDIAWRATNQLREDLTRHVLALDLPFHQKNPPGALIERVDGDVNTLSGIVSDMTMIIAANVLLMAGVLVVLVIQEPRIGLAFLGFAAAVGLLLWRLRSIARTEFEDYRQLDSEMWGFIEERIGGTEDIRANGGSAYMVARLLRKMREYTIAGVAAGYRVIFLRQTASGLFAAGSILAIVLSAELYRRGEITLGMVFMTYTYARMLADPLEQLTLQVQNLQSAIASLGRIHALLQEQPAIVERPSTPEPHAVPASAAAEGQRVSPAISATASPNGHARHGMRLPEAPLGVVFESVTFGYDADAPVLRDFSLTVPARHTVGVMGRTGSGKSTLARLLLRLYDVQAGAIRIGDIDIRDLPFEALRGAVAMVSQEVTLFHASLRENLTLFDDAVPDARLMDAIDGLALRRWFDRQPAGLDTLISPGGLSAGEAQLVAFARAFLRDPQIVVLDEAASRLDPETEAAIDAAIARLLDGRTGIVIAHRLASVERADSVLIFRNGEIVEYGDRQTLAADPDSAYRRLLAANELELA